MTAVLSAGLAAVALVGLAALAALSVRVHRNEVGGARCSAARRPGRSAADDATLYWMWSGAGTAPEGRSGSTGDGGTDGGGGSGTGASESA
ncbi:hypothetical protein O4J56_07835 [Nocardiopsis sp. RSe5-2]|uniref:Uncharacterized protein n=1 Tax=Nocardiopsis endophytica TaxID=3018445 RepID=A0ABT4U201_9ACTN|nr:hypothetical protein [Nocardiopsis endophytica]MDA2810544.1 hypothetical protein [Nocardiopsis endophytica]